MTTESKRANGPTQSSVEVKGAGFETSGENFESLSLSELMARRASLELDDYGDIVNRDERDQLNEVIQRKSIASGGIPSV